MPIKLDIRPMIASDLAAVLAIEQASFPAPWNRDHFLHEIAAPHSYPFAAVCCGDVVGYVCVTSLFEEAQILDIAVAADMRGQGIALMLMEQAISLAREKGAEMLALEVRSTNVAAIALYGRLGFVRCGLRSRYYEGIDDAVLMEKNLKETTQCSSHP
ncbi:MAG: ribosomal protein S18-alanine N-acetyltransferase [Desulfobacteraceae bacterium]|nr:ribosomal protein S18-alanine N-acetyltransferase [Desulfobacteraceae bacterium]